MSDNSKTISAIAMVLALTLVEPAEGLRQKAYKDPVGITTICYGHTGSDISTNKIYTLEECKKLLTKDMGDAISIVNSCKSGLPDNVLAAFSDAVYNIGPTIACDIKHSTAARKLSIGDFIGACNELPKWDKARVAGIMVPLPGLTIRRKREQEVCLS